MDKQEQLAPKCDKIDASMDLTELQESARNLDRSIFVDVNESNDANAPTHMETYFTALIDKLFDNKNVSAKTEYIDQDEQFTGTKLDFMIKKGGFNLVKTFLSNWEIKRLSLGRKSRIELIHALQEKENERQRQEELERQRQDRILNM